MKNIKQVVRNKEWQELRESMVGTWKHTSSQNIKKLNKYLGRKPSEDKLRRVHNYLAALRGVHNSNIKKMRDEVKRSREI